MGAKSSVLSFRSAMPLGVMKSGKDHRPTEAELDYVRAIARRAARDVFEAEQRAAADSDAPSCE
jgi:hypothetical protein